MKSDKMRKTVDLVRAYCKETGRSAEDVVTIGLIFCLLNPVGAASKKARPQGAIFKNPRRQAA
jgi:hypothetical protein